MANQVDILFNASVDDDQIDGLIKKLKEIESFGVLDLKTVGSDIEKAKKELKALTDDVASYKKFTKAFDDDKEKVNKNVLEQEKAKQKIIQAQNKGLSESEALAKKYLDTLIKGDKIKPEEWAKLQTGMSQEAQTKGVSETFSKKYLSEQHAQAIAMEKDKNKKIQDMNKKHAQAIAMDMSKTAQKKKVIQNQEVNNTKLLKQIELDIIKSNLQKEFGEKLKNFQKSKTLNTKDLQEFKDIVNKRKAVLQGEKADFTNQISQLMMFRQIGNYLKAQTKEFESFEDSLFQTGIVAGRSASEIRGMRSEIIDLGTTIPRLTQDILENITSIQRTGRTYEEAMQLITQATKLAVSSGENMALSTDVLNKALIAFNINVSDTNKVMNIFHSASIKSPLDLQKISDGLKNSASSMRNFIESTDKSGQELENYKIKILGMNTALLAGQSALGRQASSSGMSIRTLGTKLTVMEKSAKALMNTELELNSVMIKNDKIVRDGSGGIQLTAAYINELAGRDLPRAVELMSELYKSGELGTESLSKLFTGRQSPYLLAQLGLINGDMDGYIRRFTTGKEVTADYEQAIQSFSSELKLTRNSIMKVDSVYAGFLDTIGVLGMKVFRSSIENLDSMIKGMGKFGTVLKAVGDALIAFLIASTVLNITKLTAQFSGLTAVMSKYVAVTKTATAVTAAFSKVAGILTILGTIGAIVYSYHKKITNEMIRQEDITKRKKKELEDTIYELEMQNILIKFQKEEYEKLSNIDLSKNWENTYDILDATAEKMKNLVELLEISSKLSVFNLPELKTGKELIEETTKSIKEKYKTEIDTLRSNNSELLKLQEKRDKKITKTYIRERTAYKSMEDVDKLTENNKLFFEKEEHHQKRIKKMKKDNFEATLRVQKAYKNERLEIEESFKKEELNLIKEYSSLYEATLLDQINITEEMTNKSLRIMGDKIVTPRFSSEVDKDGSLLDILAGTDSTKGLQLLKEYRAEELITEEQHKAGTVFLKEKIKIEKEGYEALNKKLTEYNSLLTQSAKILSAERVDMFQSFIKKEDVVTAEQFISVMKDFKIFGDVGTTEAFEDFSNTLTKMGNKKTTQDLFDEGTLLDSISKLQSYRKSIADMNTAIVNFEAKKAVEGIDDTTIDNLESAIKYSKEQIVVSEGNIKLLYKTIDATDALAIKQSFYWDESIKQSLELQGIAKEELSLLNNKKAILDNEIEKSKSLYQFSKNSALFDNERLKSLKARQNALKGQAGVENDTKAQSELKKIYSEINNEEIILNELQGMSLEKLVAKKDLLEANDKLTKNSTEYKTLQLVLKLIELEQKRQQELNGEKKKGIEYGLEEVEIYKARAKEFDDYISKFKDLVKEEKTLGQLRQETETLSGGASREILTEELNDLLSQLERAKKDGSKADIEDLEARLDIYKLIFGNLDSIKSKEQEIINNKKTQRQLTMSSLETAKEDLKLLEEKEINLKDSNEVSQKELDLAIAKKNVAKEENDLLKGRIGTIAKLIGMFGEGGQLFSNALSGVGGLFTDKNEAGNNQFQQLAGGNIFAGLNIGMTAFGIADAFWSHSQAKKEAKMQEAQAKRDEMRNKILQSQSEIFQNTLSGLDYKSLEKAFVDSFRNSSVKDFETFGVDGNFISGYDRYEGGTTINTQVEDFEDLKKLNMDLRESIAYKSRPEINLGNYDHRDEILKAYVDRALEEFGKLPEEVIKGDTDALILAQEYVSGIIKVFEDNKPELFSSLFGFDVEAMKDDEGNITDFVTKGWNKAGDIVKKIQSDAMEGLNEINSYLGTDFVTTVSNALISNNKNIEDSLENVEGLYGELSERIRVGLDFEQDIETMANVMVQDSTGKQYDTVKNIVGDLVTEAQNLETEQTKINEDTEYLKQLWIDAGGAIADFDEALSGLDNSILDTLAKGLISQDAQSMIQEFGSLITTSITDEFKNSEAINKSFQFFGDIVKEAISTGDIGRFEKLYAQLTTNMEDINAKSLSRIGMSAEHIKQLETWQEMYKIINKLEQDSLSIYERRDALLEKANTSFTKFLDIQVSSKEEAQVWRDTIDQVKKDLDSAGLLTKQIEINSKTFLSQWVKDGNKLSSVMDMMTDSMRGVYDSTLEFLNGENYVEASSKLGTDLASSLIESYQKELLDQKYANQFVILNEKFGDALTTGSLSNIQALNNEIQKFAVQSEQERLKFDAIRDLFSMNSQIAYNQSDKNVTYETGSTKSNVYNYYNTVDITGTFIADKTSVRKLSDEIVKYLPDSMKNNNVR